LPRRAAAAADAEDLDVHLQRRDDAEQGVTTIVRGVDLLDSTAAHVHLQRVLGLAMPKYYHLPVELLGLTVPPALAGARPGVAWQWAIEQWSIDGLKGRRELAQRRE
jgi:hypothetical protein